ncbi:hypothetical protein EV426DRAFT_571573 [Tirmania nivea]|nr:hypothetical protein EV426DRAFT_571573 [Tirmania nivea]
MDLDLQRFRILHEVLWPSPGSPYTTPVIFKDWVPPATPHLTAANIHHAKKAMNPATPLPDVLHQPAVDDDAPATHVVLNLAFRAVERLQKLQAPPDLTTPESAALELIQSLLPCKTSRLLIRPAYVTFLQIMEERDRIRSAQYSALHHLNPYDAEALSEAEPILKWHIVLTGQPGIGKSFLLSYLLVYRLLQGLPTIFQQAGSAHYYFFNSNGVTVIPLRSEHYATNDHNIWALVDTKPDPTLWSSTSWLIIQASSPRLDNYKAFRKHANAKLIYMDVWSWWELRAAHYLCYPKADAEAELYLYEVFVKFGPIARLVLDVLHPYHHGSVSHNQRWQQSLDNQITVYERELDVKISKLVRSDVQAFTTSEWGVDSPHAVILVLPASLDENDFRPHCSISSRLALASAYIGHKVGQAVGRSVVQELRNTFEFFRQVPQTVRSAGWIFEGIMHARLSQPETEIHFGGIGRKEAGQERFSTATKCAGEMFTSLAVLGEMLREKKGSHKIGMSAMGKYFRPSFSNLGAFDGLLILPCDTASFPMGTIVLVQITLAEDHPIKISSLEKLYESLPADARGGKWVMLFMVPRPGSHRVVFAKQRFESTNRGNAKGGGEARKWEEKVIQMVCFVEEKEIWDAGRTLGLARARS